MNQPNLPAYLTNRRGLGLAESLAPLLTTGQPAHISIRRNTFTLIDAAGNEKPVNALHLDVVIVGTNKHMSKIYYGTGYDPENSSPPDCWSDNGLAPSSRASTPQSQTCAVCPKNVWGSDVSKMTGKQTKACNDVMKLAVIVPGDTSKLVYLLRIPPATLKHLGKYVQTLAANMIGDRRADPSDVVTRLTFDAQTQGVLNFAPVSLIDEATCQLVDSIDPVKVIAPIVGMNDVPIGPGRVAAQVTAPAAHMQQLPPPVPQGFMPQPTTPQPQQEAAAPRAPGRPRKPRADAAPAPAAPQQAPFMPQPGGIPAPAEDPSAIPAFLQRNPPPAPPAPPVGGFGLAQGTPPDAGLQAALAAAFNLPTGNP